MSSAGNDALPDIERPMRFSVLLPVHRPPALLPYAIETVLAQSVADFELLIVCDGAPQETIACARTYAARDQRVKVLPFPKGPFAGEVHRHVALTQARGGYIAHIADDDLWFPNHLEEMEKLLRRVDFGHLTHVNVNADGSFEILAGDLGTARLRERMLTEDYNVLGDTVTGYRLDAYRRLPEGWAPQGFEYPDLKMWRKFLRESDLTFGSRIAITALIFPSEIRRHMSLDDRARELRHWHDRILDPTEREEIAEQAWRSLMRYVMHIEDDRRARLQVIGTMSSSLATMNARRLKPDFQIDFSEQGNSFLYIASGWSFPEMGFRWTDGTQASIRVRLDSPPNGSANRKWVLRLRAKAFDGRQRVAVLMDGQPAGEVTVDGSIRDYDIDVDFPRLERDAEKEIVFQLPDAHSPASVGLGADERKLGLAVSSIAFLPSAPSG